MSCSSEGCSTSAPGRQPERVLGEITDITLFSPGKKKNNRGDHLQLQLITADCVAAAQVPGNQEIGDNAIRALFSTFPPPYLNLKPSWPRDREGSRVCKHPTQSFPVFLYQAAGLRQPVKISTYFCSPEVRPRIAGPPGPSRPISPVHESFTQ